jgi:hypothetical protein
VIRASRLLAPSFNLRIVSSEPSLAPLVDVWRILKKQIFDSYRPELHYMRGPGPKWRERHAHVTSVSRYP